MYKCKYCGKEFDSPAKLGGHTSKCKLNPNYQYNMDILAKARSYVGKHNNGKHEFIHKNEICECQYCHKQYKLYGLKTHENYCVCNPNRKEHSEAYINRDNPGHGWNRGLTKETDERVKRSSEKLHNGYSNGTYKNWCEGKTKENNDTVKKIAEANSKYMKKKHQEGKAFYWGKYGRVSYPEQYFINIFNEEFPPYEYNYHELTYYLDFAWVQSKKYIEIDGEQHKKQIEHDIKRDNELKEIGWKCIRVDWVKFIRLNENERRNFINQLKHFIID